MDTPCFTATAAHQFEALPADQRDRVRQALDGLAARPAPTSRLRERPARRIDLGSCRILLDDAGSAILAVYLTTPRH